MSETRPAFVITPILPAPLSPTRAALVAQKRALCNYRADLDREIIRLQTTREAISQSVALVDNVIAALDSGVVFE